MKFGWRRFLPIEFDFLFDFLEPLMAEARQADALLEQAQRLIERKLFRLEALDDRLQLLERLLEIVAAPDRHSGRFIARYKYAAGIGCASSSCCQRIVRTFHWPPMRTS